MHVLFLSSEVAPYSKTGGLGDVAGALPQALGALGIRVTVVSPKYASVNAAQFGLARRLSTLAVPLGRSSIAVSIYEGRMPGGSVPIYFVDHEPFYGRAALYGEAAEDYPDNARRFALLARAALEVGRTLTHWPDVIHAHDWQTALAPFLLRQGAFPNAPRTGTVLTIHNLAFQGLFPRQTVEDLGIGWDAFHIGGVEFYGQLGFLKAGIVFSDRLTTVSPRYAREIQTPELGCGLDGLLRHHSDKLVGILNGVDYDVWDPARDPLIAKRFTPDNLSGKAACKAELQKGFGLPVRAQVPLLGSISRLTEQKGFDLIIAMARDLAKLNVQYVILGSGEAAMERAVSALAAEYPGKVAVRIGYDNQLAHQIEAGADLFVMPSRFEPCGLSQLYSLRYGTLPLVRSTGGLDDTVVDWDPRTRTGNGFKFSEYSAPALLETLRRAIQAYQDKPGWQQAIDRAMRQDFSWTSSARRYADLYEHVVQERTRPGSLSRHP